MQAKAFLFDMDGVIIDSNPTHRKALLAFAQRKGVFLDEAEFESRLWGRSNKDWIPDFLGDHLTKEEVLRLGEEKEEIFREMFAPQLRAVPGTVEFLTAAQQAGIPMAVGTSAPLSNLDFVLDGLQLRPFFQALVHEALVARGKPDPAIYQKAAELLGVPAQRCVVFEDARSGVKAALAAGCQVVGITTTHTPEELPGCALYADDFTDLQPAAVAALIP